MPMFSEEQDDSLEQSQCRMKSELLQLQPAKDCDGIDLAPESKRPTSEYCQSLGRYDSF